MYNRLVALPGQAIRLGKNGGRLLLNPPAQIPGQLTFQTMQNRIWHLLREPGPLTGDPIPVTGDYAQDTVAQDLNIMLGQFVGDTGLAPMISDKFVTVPVFPVLDYPVPPDTQSLTRVEYTPAGQQTYTLESKSFNEFDAYWADDTLSTGQPYVYREMFAGYIRLFPQPGPGNALGPGTGEFTFNGTITAGNAIQVVLANVPNTPVIVPTYIVQAGDTLESIAQSISTLINNSNACIGPTPFLQPSGTAANQVTLTGLNPPGTNITYQVNISTGATITVTPNGQANLTPNGDTMNFYYSSTGNFMLFANDTPGIPSQFHMVLVYGVLSDYWNRKQDPTGNAAYYLKRYLAAVEVAKGLEWDAKRDVQPTLGGYYDSDLDYGWSSY